ncbi:MAG: 3'(2'),5'-bisphosphate nucleotidase CysQ [Deltaproteobacteria bacterium]|nr:3'(2'),5'-bisphosphate nucleotidase CysQ [Deltaproteobacteria bacterium]
MLKKNINDLLDLAMKAADAACGLISERIESIRTIGGDWDGSGHPHTNVDIEADGVIHDILGGAHGVAYLSEERADDESRLGSDLVWVVDPLDGTRNLLTGYRCAVVSIALVARGEPVAGVIQNPFTGEVFSAMKDGGAFLNGAAIHVSPGRRFEKGRVVLSRTENGQGILRKYEKLFRFDLLGSCAYKMAVVACGRYDITFTEKERNEWDTAAGDIIAREAGGRVTDFSGGRVVYNKKVPVVKGLICSNGQAGNDFKRLLKNL